MTTKVFAGLSTLLLAGVALYATFQSRQICVRVVRLEDAQRDHDARKGQRETFFYKILPVLAAVFGVAATAGWLR